MAAACRFIERGNWLPQYTLLCTRLLAVGRHNSKATSRLFPTSGADMGRTSPRLSATGLRALIHRCTPNDSTSRSPRRSNVRCMVHGHLCGEKHGPLNLDLQAPQPTDARMPLRFGCNGPMDMASQVPRIQRGVSPTRLLHLLFGSACKPTNPACGGQRSELSDLACSKRASLRPKRPRRTTNSHTCGQH